jgi:phosphoribosylanthranilate isomerase
VVKIKVCGISRLDDAYAAVDAGVDYLGFIFYDRSPRHTNREQVRTIALELKASGSCPILIGVFVNETAGVMASVLDFCGLDLAQLSGEEPPELITDPSTAIYGRSFKGIRPLTESEATSDSVRYRPPDPTDSQPLLLIDAYHATLRGGTGQVADWRLAANLSRHIPRLMLAGGLNASNVSAAIGAVQPYAVDVASGVEDSPGIKNPDKIRAFVRAARSSQ